MENNYVAIYVDLENIAMSRYDSVFGKAEEGADNARRFFNSHIKRKEAKVNLRLVREFATTFGAVTISRVYTDWSRPAFAEYKSEMQQGAFDLVQLFPVSGTKNGADIRLATDVVEDIGRYPHITHVLIVAGDSDYISVAQKVRQRGLKVIGLASEGSYSSIWKDACDIFLEYEKLPLQPMSVPNPSDKVTEQVSDRLNNSADLLMAVLRNPSETQIDKHRFLLSTLKTDMTKLNPNFDNKSEGFQKFRGFLAQFTGLKLDPENDTHIIWDGRPLEVRIDEAPVAESNVVEKCRKSLGGNLVYFPITVLDIAAASTVVGTIQNYVKIVNSQTLVGIRRVVDDALESSSIVLNNANRMRLLSERFVFSVVRNGEGDLIPNPEVTESTIDFVLTRSIAEFMRETVAEATEENLIEAIWGENASEGLIKEIHEVVLHPRMDELEETLKEWFVYPLDFSRIWAAARNFEFVADIEALKQALTPLLVDTNTPAEKVSWESVWRLLTCSNLIVEQAGGWKITDVDPIGPGLAQRILEFYLMKLSENGISVPGFNHACSLVLPERNSLEGREMVRKCLSEASQAAASTPVPQ